jgi:hypothetical protein
MRTPAKPDMLLMPLLAALALPLQAAERTPVSTTPHFAFHSDFDTNLNDALIAAGLARKRSKPELLHSGAEANCFQALPPSTRAAWDKAVDYYAEIVSPARWDGRPQILIRLHLAGFDEELQDAAARQFVEIAKSFRAAATPAYQACRWTAQDQANRRWIEALRPLLKAHEQQASGRLEQLYAKKWSLPFTVDVVQTVNWAGANSYFPDRGGGHLLISIENESRSAFEVVFHEASHQLIVHDDPLPKALTQAATKKGAQLPGDLTHVVLFYTTGEAVRPILGGNDKTEGTAAYRPMLYEIFARGDWTEYRTPLETAWRPCVDGQRSLGEAATALIEALPAPKAK